MIGRESFRIFDPNFLKGTVSMSLQALFFDMGGTIETFGYHRETGLAATRGLREALRGAGIDPGLEEEALYERIRNGLARYKQWSLVSLEELPPARVWADYVFAGLPVDRQKLEAAAEQLAFLVETTFYERAMRPEMPAVLQEIQNLGLKIGLISNVNSRGQVPENLSRYGIRHYFDPIVLSSEYGRRKPDPAIFHYAARLANVPTGACLYVGDRIARDILGARKAGFRLAVQIRHDFDHGEQDTGAVPDHVIGNMLELVEIVKAELNRKQPEVPPHPIRALLFDAGDILYHRPEKGTGFRAFLEELGLPPDQNHAAEREALAQQAYRGRIDQDRYRELLLNLYGVHAPEAVARGKRVLEADDHNVEFMEGVTETLLALKARGYLLAIVTDSVNPVHAKLKWFESAGIGHLWDSFIASMEVGTRKPDPQIYHAALRQLGVPPTQAAFVGHKATELEGARQVGMQTIAFNRDEDAEADICIDRFGELLKLPLLS